MDSQGFSDNSRLRASDADRDRAAAVINSAMAEGRLTADEHSERLDAIYAAKTHADIVPLLDDLPGLAPAVAATPTPGELSAPAGSHDRIVALLSGATRKGSWHAEPVIDIVTVLGGVELDFRGAVLAGREVTIRAVCVLGGVNITVPPEMRVMNSAAAILGGVETAGDSAESLAPDAPVLRIVGTCVLGGIDIKRKARKSGKGWRQAIADQ